MTNSEQKKAYEALQKKHKLPNLEVLENTFLFTELEECVPVLAGVRRKIVEKAEYFVALLSELLNQDADLTNIYEYRTLDEKSKTEIFDVYKKLMSLSRHSSMLNLGYDEAGEVEFIKSANEKWPVVTSVLKKYLFNLKKEWEKKEATPPKEIIDYWG